ncbi:Protein NYNRIN [Aix galericulata]|nr:Protein NYNRIN [Aix galericulata]
MAELQAKSGQTIQISCRITTILLTIGRLRLRQYTLILPDHKIIVLTVTKSLNQILIDDDLRKLERPIKSSLLTLGASQLLLSDVLPHWEHIEENDQLIVNALGKTQGNTSLALSCIQAQLWIQSRGRRNFVTHYAENDKIVAFILTISNATVYNVYPIIALRLNHNGTILYPKEHEVWAHQKGGKWPTIDVNACIVHEQKGFICESNTLEAQDTCLDTEQSICHFEIHPNETLETVLVYIGKGCVCMRTHCDSIVIDNTIVDTSHHSNVCVCNFTKILGCDFSYAAPVNSCQGIAPHYINLPPTPIGLKLTLVKKLLLHEDLKWLIKQV